MILHCDCGYFGCEETFSKSEMEDSDGTNLAEVTVYVCPVCGERCEDYEAADSTIRVKEEKMEPQGILLGKADINSLIRKAVDWLLHEADSDEAADVLGRMSGTKVFVSQKDQGTAYVYDDAGDYSEMFKDVLEKEALAMCDRCQYKSGETEFHVLENGKWLGSLQCPVCKSTAITVADTNL